MIICMKDEVAEWLRRWTANPLCFARVGSNPTLVVFFFLPKFKIYYYYFFSIQWWDTEGQELKKVQLKGTYGKFVKFSPDFNTFVTIDNAGMLYVLSAIQDNEE